MAKRFRIHPAIGVARVGNSPEGFFIGPEGPGIPGNWDSSTGAFAPFRDPDKDGAIKRQGARFRVFEYQEDDKGLLSSPKEVVVGGEVADIEWRVHVANKKASFFTFNSQSGLSEEKRGFSNVYVTRSERPATDHEKGNVKDPDDPEDPERKNRRNPDVPAADRQRLLELDPGEKLISQAALGPVVLTNPNPNVTFIPDLGELRLDEAGRLIFLGGHGTSGSTEKPARVINEYANNDTWFDDLSDGSVKARIRFKSGEVADADAAWVLVGPPDFAPGIGNVVTLFDTLWDIAVRSLPAPRGTPRFSETPLNDLAAQRSIWKDGSDRPLKGYGPSFTREIYPILKRALGARYVFDPGPMESGYHSQLLDYATLASPPTSAERDEGQIARQEIFRRMRDPASTQPIWSRMPRGHGDRYDALDDANPQTAETTSFLSLTPVQYALLAQWADGQFQSDWQGEPPIPAPGAVTPQGLDQAATENCVGGPFYPGIEVSWLIRATDLYAEPFRLKVDPKPESKPAGPGLKIGAMDFGPGFFSQQMALPWQADFYDCHKEEHRMPVTEPQPFTGKNAFFMWWTAQRPDDVFPRGGAKQVRWVREFDKAKTTEDPDNLKNLARFSQMQLKWGQLRLVIAANGRFEEEP